MKSIFTAQFLPLPFLSTLQKIGIVTLVMLGQLFATKTVKSQVLYGLTYAGGTEDFGAVIKYDNAGASLSVQKSFVAGAAGTGIRPSGSFIEASNGKLYGMTSEGGTNDVGTIVEYDITNNTLTKKADLTSGTTGTGTNPNGSFLEASNGKLYAMTFGGGANGAGTVIEYDFISNTLTKKADFTYGNTGTGVAPNGAFIEAETGKLFAMTSRGGGNNAGTVVEFNITGNTLTNRANFTNGTAGTGMYPHGSFIKASNGKLYGMTSEGGAFDFGTVVEYDLTGNSLIKKASFSYNATGATPYGSFVEAYNVLYGITSGGGANGVGAVVSYFIGGNTINKVADLASFNTGSYSRGSALKASNGKLFFMTSLGAANNFGAVVEYDIFSNTLTKKADFTSTNGASPLYGNLIELRAAPVVTTSAGNAVYMHQQPIIIDPSITLTDADNTTLKSATVSITGGFASGEDVLSFTNYGMAMGGISGAYNAATGELLLTSAASDATVAEYASALASVQYENTATSPSTANRTISFVANDGTANSETATKTVTVNLYGASLNFDGVNDYVDATTTTGLPQGAQPRTVEAWVKTTQTSLGNIVSWGTQAANRRMSFAVSNGKAAFIGQGNDIEGNKLINDNLWHHIVLTYDGITLKLYVDGVLDLSSVRSINTLGQNLVIGTTTVSATTEFYSGSLDEVRIWNRALCPREIVHFMNCEITSAQYGLLVNYHFNHGVASGDNTTTPENTLFDASGYANDGTLTNFALTGPTSNWVAPGSVTSDVSCGILELPFIAVQGNGSTIYNGQNTPSSSDHTDFETVNTGSSLDRTYTINNDGPGNLTISTITKTGTHASDFVVSGITLPATIAGYSSTTFTVTFTPGASGTRMATIQVNSDDCDQPNYNFAIEGTGVTTTSSPTDYFRSRITGNWNDPNTWQTATDAAFTTGVVSPATLSPDFNANTITIQSPDIVTVTADVITDQTTVDAGGTISVNSGVVLSINDGSGADIVVNGTVNGTGNMTINSTAAGTASVGNSSGNISVASTVERYIPDNGHRAWRALSVPVTGTQTIKEAWQEGGAAVNNKGTLITSNLYPTATGFDGSSNRPSILIYDQGGVSGPSWETIPVPNTDVTRLDSRSAWMLFVRGDRNATPANSLRDVTTLRSTGTLKQGTQPAVIVSSIGSGYTFVANPYASTIDIEGLLTRTNNLDQQYYVWDANLNGVHGVGGFRLIERNGGAYRQTPQPIGGTGSATPDAGSRYINSGQAMFLKATTSDASVVFVEGDKTEQLSSINPFRELNTQPELLANLLVRDQNNNSTLADGIRVNFDNSYSVNVTGEDAIKISNFSNNLGMRKGNKMLIVEKRPEIIHNDTIYLNLANTTSGNYSLQIAAKNMPPTIMAYLVDNHLGTQTAIDLNNITSVDFSTTGAAAGSYAADRFKIVFSQAGTLPITLSSVRAYEKENNISVEWKVENEAAMKHYEVEKSVDGRSFTKATTQAATGNNNSTVTYKWLDVNATAGNHFYRIKSMGSDGAIKLSEVVKVTIGKGKADYNIYPNPMVGNLLNVQFINQPKGRYTVKLLNSLGQVVVRKTITHEQGSSSETLEVGSKLSKGNYLLEITSSTGKKHAVKIIR